MQHHGSGIINEIHNPSIPEFVQSIWGQTFHVDCWYDHYFSEFNGNLLLNEQEKSSNRYATARNGYAENKNYPNHQAALTSQYGCSYEQLYPPYELSCKYNAQIWKHNELI